MPGLMAQDSKLSEEDGIYNNQQQEVLDRAPGRHQAAQYFQENKEAQMKIDLPSFNGGMDVEKIMDWVKNVEFLRIKRLNLTRSF